MKYKQKSAFFHLHKQICITTCISWTTMYSQQITRTTHLTLTTYQPLSARVSSPNLTPCVYCYAPQVPPTEQCTPSKMQSSLLSFPHQNPIVPQFCVFEAKVNLHPCGVSTTDCDQRSVSGFLSHLISLDWYIDSSMGQSHFRRENVDICDG